MSIFIFDRRSWKVMKLKGNEVDKGIIIIVMIIIIMIVIIRIIIFRIVFEITVVRPAMVVVFLN